MALTFFATSTLLSSGGWTVAPLFLEDVGVEVPAQGCRHQPWSAAEVSADLRLLWLVDQVRRRRLGYPKAAELAQLSQAAFVEVLGMHRISPFDLDEEELEREIASGKALGGA